MATRHCHSQLLRELPAKAEVEQTEPGLQSQERQQVAVSLLSPEPNVCDAVAGYAPLLARAKPM